MNNRHANAIYTGHMILSFIRTIALACLVSVISTGCERGTDRPPVPSEDSHTFIMYAVANNNLRGFLNGNVNMAMQAVINGIPENTRILVYWDDSSTTNLSEIVRNSDGTATKIVLKEYGEQTSTAPAVMRQVLNDVQTFAPAEVYGISLLGHGTGWFPSELNNLQQPASGEPCLEHDLRRPEDALTRAYGADGAALMSPDELVSGLAPIYFDYIVFDLCFMSSIELLYDLRYNADYILASPVEVMGDGIPYHLMLPRLFDRNYTIPQRLANATNAIVDYYNVQSYPSAAFTVVETDKLQKVADAVKAVFATETSEPDFGEIQYLELLSPEHAFFDLRSYIRNIATDGSMETQAALAELEAALADVTIAERHTPRIYSALGFGGGFFEASDMCGISSYIPREWLPVTMAAYYETEWARYTRPQQ